MNFNFESPSRIIFGKGTIAQLPDIARDYGRECLLITSNSIARYSLIIDSIKAASIRIHNFCIDTEPSIDIIDSATTFARQSGVEFVIGIGGGSVIDAAKAVSIMIPNHGTVLDYLEVVGKGHSFKEPAVPCIAVPTTSGTGAEVTKNSVLFSQEHSIKVSMRSAYMMPKVALVDPELTITVPAEITAYTGMDALTQVIEPFLSCMSNEFTDTICRDAIAKGGPALLKAFHEPDNITARTDISYVSLMGGLALANAKLGAVHGFAGVIGGMFKAPHGAICAALLPGVLEANIKAVKERGSETQTNKYDELALLLTRNPMADAADAVVYIRKMVDAMNIKGLGEYGVTAGDIDTIIAAAKNSSSMKGNTLPLTDNEMSKILFKAL